MNMTEVRYPAAQMRASDTDRDAVVATLSEAYQAGRLTSDEFDDRTGRALAARTLGELASLTADLPRPGPGEPQPEPAGARRYAPVVLAVLAAALIVAGLAFLGAFGVADRGHHGAELWWLIPVALLAGRRLARRADRR